MAPARLLERNVRPLRSDDDGRAQEPDVDAFSGDDLEDGDEESALDGSESGTDTNIVTGGSEGEDEHNHNRIGEQMNNISFGSLKQAQDALSRKRKRNSDATADQEEKLTALRARLQEIKSERNANKAASVHERDSSRKERKGSNTQYVDVESGDEIDQDSAPSEEEAMPKSRTSKHAPRSQPSKYQVTRKRAVVDVPKRVTRDPRFDALQSSSTPNGNNEKAYSFLIDYQKDEIAELKLAIKRTKNEDDKETLKRKLVSMENRLKSHAAKEREREVLRQHRKAEKERVQQGKKPFYLKKKEVKDRALVDKFKGMKGKDREKLIERRRRKEGQREKKRMPDARRIAG